MNRSITNVLFGGIATQAQSQRKIEGQVTQTSIEDTVEALVNAENVIIVSATCLKQKTLCLTNVWIRSWDMVWRWQKRNMPYPKSLVC
jgi:NAD(P) transhydrogenase beta subunit